MVSKTVYLACLLSLAQYTLSQCIGKGLPYSGSNLVLGPIAQPPCNVGPINQISYPSVNDISLGSPSLAGSGGSFVVSCSSPVAASGLSILADNLIIDGTLSVNGRMPFLGAVSVDGSVPAAGQGSVVYNSGNGDIGIISEGVSPLFGSGLQNLQGLNVNGLNVNGLGINRFGCGCA